MPKTEIFTHEANYILSNTYLLFLSYLLSSRMTCNKYQDTGSDYINKTLNSIDPFIITLNRILSGTHN